MVVAVILVGVVQVAGHQVVDMLAVGNRLMAAIGAVGVIAGVSGSISGRDVTVGVLGVDVEGVLVDVVAVGVMEVTVVEVVDVVTVANRRMPALGPVLMGVIGVNGVL